MRIKNLFPGTSKSPSSTSSNAVVVGIERRSPAGAPQVSEADVDQLAALLRSRVGDLRLGHYDGCDTFPGESRLYFFSREADRLAAVVMEVVNGVPWRQHVHVRVSLDPLGASWRRVEP